jgi:hypothetical protein
MQFFVDFRNKIVMEAQPIPNTWRHNPITLLPKNLKQFKQPHEFRPITLLDNQYRGLSHDIWLRLKKHVKNNNIISKFQSGTMKGRSTADNSHKYKVGNVGKRMDVRTGCTTRAQVQQKLTQNKQVYSVRLARNSISSFSRVSKLSWVALLETPNLASAN